LREFFACVNQFVTLTFFSVVDVLAMMGIKDKSPLGEQSMARLFGLGTDPSFLEPGKSLGFAFSFLFGSENSSLLFTIGNALFGF
jgi:hypothetical protein